MSRVKIGPGRTAALSRAVAVLGAATLAVAGLAAPAQAADRSLAPTWTPSGAAPAGFSSWQDLFAIQSSLNATADKLYAAKGAGYAGIVAAPENGEVRLYWKGSVPSTVRSLADRQSVPVKILSARYSEREMSAAAQKLVNSGQFTSASPKADGSGVQATVAGTATAARGATAAALTALPVSIEAGVKPELLSRQADIYPYWGGSRYYAGGGCSTGFAVYQGGLSRILSAGHCGVNGQYATTGGGVGIGYIYGDNDPRDTLLIDQRAQGAVYGGAWNSASGYAVGGAARNYVGNYVCSSGASSGENCNLQVQAVGQYINIGYVIGPMVLGVNIYGQCAAAPGDSGGPLISGRADGYVDARGTVSAGATGTATCAGVSPSGSYYVYYADIADSLALYGASIVIYPNY